MIKKAKSVSGKTSYILGAGCSCHAGIPLVGNFWVKAKQIARTSAKLEASIRQLSEIISELRGEYSNKDNIEELFAFFEVVKECGLPAGNSYKTLMFVLSSTIGYTCEHAMRSGPDRLYSTFVKNLSMLNEMRGAFRSRFYRDPCGPVHYGSYRRALCRG